MSRSRAAAAGWVVDLGAQALAEDSAMMRRLSITIRSSADLTYRKSLVAFEGQRLAPPFEPRLLTPFGPVAGIDESLLLGGSLAYETAHSWQAATQSRRET